MIWVNPLDKVPQVPSDWANHIIYGGFLGMAIALFSSPIDGFLITLMVSALKKAIDWALEDEDWKVCLGKTFVTVLWPASIWLFTSL